MQDEEWVGPLSTECKALYHRRQNSSKPLLWQPQIMCMVSLRCLCLPTFNVLTYFGNEPHDHVETLLLSVLEVRIKTWALRLVSRTRVLLNFLNPSTWTLSHCRQFCFHSYYPQFVTDCYSLAWQYGVWNAENVSESSLRLRAIPFHISMLGVECPKLCHSVIVAMRGAEMLSHSYRQARRKLNPRREHSSA
jgi:hypothetical protein